MREPIRSWNWEPASARSPGGLIAAGVAPERLILLEREAELADVLRREYPKARVIEGDAGQIGWWLSHLGVARLRAVVSTLPIVWFPANLQRAILAQCFRHLPAEGRFVQVTNRPASPVPHARLGYGGERFRWVWRNLPPAAVWRYWRGCRATPPLAPPAAVAWPATAVSRRRCPATAGRRG